MITGETGSGKTIACRVVVDRLSPDWHPVFYVAFSTDSSWDTLNAIARQFALPKYYRRADAWTAVQRQITKMVTEKQQHPVLIVAEAHFLSDRVLDDLRLLLNFGMDDQPRLTLILVGLSELARRLALAAHQSLRHRLVLRYQMTRLQGKEIEPYLSHRLALAGVPQSDLFFDAKALDTLRLISEGIPRTGEPPRSFRVGSRRSSTGSTRYRPTCRTRGRRTWDLTITMPQSSQFPDLALLRQLPLVPLAIWLGYRQDPEDPRHWKRDDSILSVNHEKFFDHLTHTGGYGTIDLVAHARSCSDREAIRLLANPADDRSVPPSPIQALADHPHHPANWPVVRDYLTSVRGLPGGLVDRCRQLGLIQADYRRNALFLCTNAHRRPTGAELVGTFQRPDGSRFRALTRGSRKTQDSFWLPVDQAKPHTVILTESAIDTLSAWCSLPELRSSGTVFVSSAGTTPQLPQWLCRWNFQRILCAFDADASGDHSAARLLQRHPNAQRLRPPGAKDWNDLLRGQRSVPRIPTGFSFPSSQFITSLPVENRASLLADPPQITPGLM